MPAEGSRRSQCVAGRPCRNRRRLRSEPLCKGLWGAGVPPSGCGAASPRPLRTTHRNLHPTYPPPQAVGPRGQPTAQSFLDPENPLADLRGQNLLEGRGSSVAVITLMGDVCRPGAPTGQGWGTGLSFLGPQPELRGHRAAPQPLSEWTGTGVQAGLSGVWAGPALAKSLSREASPQWGLSSWPVEEPRGSPLSGKGQSFQSWPLPSSSAAGEAARQSQSLLPAPLTHFLSCLVWPCLPQLPLCPGPPAALQPQTRHLGRGASCNRSWRSAPARGGLAGSSRAQSCREMEALTRQ